MEFTGSSDEDNLKIKVRTRREKGRKLQVGDLIY